MVRSSSRSPLYQLASEVVEAYAESPGGSKRLDDAMGRLDLALNEIDQSLAMLDALRERLPMPSPKERVGMDPKPLLIGEAPGPGGGTCDPLGRKTARRLCEFAGWGPEGDGEDPYRDALSRRFELRNLLNRPMERVPGSKGCRFPLHEARRASESLDLRGRVVVALGKRVAGALGIAKPEYFRWETVRGCTIVCVCHPSGVNRALNDPNMKKRTGLTLNLALGLKDAWKR